MKKLALFASVLFLVVAASSDACLGQRTGLRSGRAVRQSMAPVRQVQTVTTVRVQSFATSCSGAVRQPLVRRRSVGCAGSVQAATGCAGSRMAPAMPASTK